MAPKHPAAALSERHAFARLSGWWGQHVGRNTPLDQAVQAAVGRCITSGQGFAGLPPAYQRLIEQAEGKGQPDGGR